VLLKAFAPWLRDVLFLALIGLVAAWARRLKRRWDTEEALAGLRFQPVALLRSASERAAWDLLRRTDLGQAHVFAKVRLEDVVEVKAGDERARQIGRNRIKSRHIDFLLTDAASRPILAVEVDGGSHRTARAAEGDELKNQVLARAGVPLVRLRVGEDWAAVLANGHWSRRTDTDPVEGHRDGAGDRHG
jgi:hypothetical protein